MIITVLLLSAVCALVQSSGIHPVVPAGPPVVTAASSQYFERTYNRLVAAPPVVPVAPPPVVPIAPVQPVFQVVPAPSFVPLAPAPPIVIDAKTASAPTPTNPPQNTPLDPNVAIAIATAHAAAPVATILLPPYPFGLPPSFGLLPQPTFNIPSENPNKESTTQKSTTVEVDTERNDESTTALPSNIDNSFAQALPSNENVNFRQYYGPPRVQPQSQPRPQSLPRPQNNLVPQAFPRPQSAAWPQTRPQKLKTTVEIVPVPLAYIAPPPHHQHLKLTKYIHSFIPKKAKIIIRPVSAPLRIRTVRLVSYKPLTRIGTDRYPQKIIQSRPRDPEPTTFRPFTRPITKPPRI